MNGDGVNTLNQTDGTHFDHNGNGVTDAGELLTLAQAGIKSFNVTYTSSDSTDANGNIRRWRGMKLGNCKPKNVYASHD